MNAQELRLGNFINKHFENGEGQLEEVTSRTIFDCLTNPTGKFSYTSIPLTPEILEKCGFEKVKSPYEEAETDDFFLAPLYFDMANTSIKINGVYQKINYPESLHQLQNLYHALTGEELTYNAQ